MKASRGNIIRVVVTVVLASGVIYVVSMAILTVVFFLAPIKAISDRANRGQEHLFYETDYEELLAACRELSQRVAEGNLKPKRYHVFWEDPDPNASTFPQVILDLEPSIVGIDTDGVVDLELLPGVIYLGVKAFPEGQEGWGDVKLIEGLRYYDSECDQYANHMRRIDAMIEEGRKRKAARAATQPESSSGRQVPH